MSAPPSAVPDGVLLIDKPKGWTSSEVVRSIQRRIRPVKVGHTGTLDPMATGLLPLSLGEATKLSRWLTGGRKRYRATVRLGLATDTLDAEGQPVEQAAVPVLEEQQVRRVLNGLVGPTEQVPPMYSAVHHRGRRLYELARQGLVVEREARRVELYAVELLELQADGLELDVACSAGTYVRRLAADIGKLLGTCAHLAGLVRTEASGFRLDEATSPLDLKHQALADRVVDLERVLARFERVDVETPTARRLGQGQRLSADELSALGVAVGPERIVWFRPPEAAPLVLARLLPAGPPPAMEILRVLRPIS